MIDLNPNFKHKLRHFVSMLNTTNSLSESSELLQSLRDILKKEGLNGSELENLRNKIKSQIKLDTTSLSSDGIHVTTILYFLLFSLTELNPLNEDCVKSFEPIPMHKKIFLTNGYQYNIDVILEHIARRNAFIDIYTNDLYNEFEIALILLATDNNKDLQHLLPKHINIEALESLQVEILKLQSSQYSQDEEIQQQLDAWAESKVSTVVNPTRQSFAQFTPLLRENYQTTAAQQGSVTILSISIIEDDHDENDICSRLVGICTIS